MNNMYLKRNIDEIENEEKSKKTVDADGYKIQEVTKVCVYCGNHVIKTSPNDHWCPKCGHDIII